VADEGELRAHSKRPAPWWRERARAGVVSHESREPKSNRGTNNSAKKKRHNDSVAQTVAWIDAFAPLLRQFGCNNTQTIPR